MGKYKAGDLIRVTKGDVVMQGRVADVQGKGREWDLVLPLPHRPEDLGQAVFIDWYEVHGYEVEVIEEAKPKLEIPTEYGIYVPAGDHADRIYVLDEDGWAYYRHGLATRRTGREMIDALANAEHTELEKLVRLVREDGK